MEFNYKANKNGHGMLSVEVGKASVGNLVNFYSNVASGMVGTMYEHLMQAFNAFEEIGEGFDDKEARASAIVLKVVQMALDIAAEEEGMPLCDAYELFEKTNLEIKGEEN